MTADRSQHEELFAALLAMKQGEADSDAIRQVDELTQNNPGLLRLYIEYTRLLSDLRFDSNVDRIDATLARTFGADVFDDRVPDDKFLRGPTEWELQHPEGDFVPAVEDRFSGPFGSAPSAPPPSVGRAFYGAVGRFSSEWCVAYSVATLILVVGLIVAAVTHVSRSGSPDSNLPVAAGNRPSAVPNSAAAVARITGMVDCRWQGTGDRGQGTGGRGQGTGGRGQGTGDRGQNSPGHSTLSTTHYPLSTVSLGDTLALESGLLELTYDTGARVILQGPVTYKVDSAAGGYLAVGKLTAKLEKREQGAGDRGQSVTTNQASSSRRSLSTLHSPLSTTSDPSLSTTHYPLFTIKTPTATVTDLGTEFGVEVEKNGTTTSYVFSGSVELQLTGNAHSPQQTVRLAKDESARVGASPDPQETHIRRVACDPSAFVRSDQFSKAARRGPLKSLHYWQAYNERIRRDPALVVYYDFRYREASPCVLHPAAPNGGGSLNGIVIQGDLPDTAAIRRNAALNLLEGKPVKASSSYKTGAEYQASHLTDNTSAAHAFHDGDFAQRLVVHGFNSKVSTIRLWRWADRIPQQVTIKSSTSDRSSLNTADYETTLAILPTINFNTEGYVDISVAGPPGTRCLFFDFGHQTEMYPTGGWKTPAGISTVEIQAFAANAAVASPTGWATPGRAPESTALHFDGDRTRVIVNIPQQLTQMTFAAWLTVEFLNDKDATCGLLTSEDWDKPADSPRPLSVRWHLSRSGEIQFGTPAYRLVAPAVLPWRTWNRNRWRHLAVVADPAHQKATCYLDGKPVFVERLPKDFAAIIGPAAIGAWQSGGGLVHGGFRGRMDELLILSRAMTDREINQLFEAGKP